MTLRSFLRRTGAHLHPLIPDVLLDASAGRLALMYHSVHADNEEIPGPYSISATQFERQITFLDERATLIGPDELLTDPAPDGLEVLLTFDDGYRNNATVVRPLLEQYEAPATIFVTDGLINADRATYLDWDGLRDLAGSELITIGSHGSNHLTLTGLRPEDATREIEESRDSLEAQLDADVRYFSYPNGGFSKDLAAAVEAAGYDAAFKDCMSVREPNDRRYAIGRVGVSRANAGLDRFAATVATVEPIDGIQ